jgi:hypothetical protein
MPWVNPAPRLVPWLKNLKFLLGLLLTMVKIFMGLKMKRKVHRNEPGLNLWVMEYFLYQGRKRRGLWESSIPWFTASINSLFAYMDDV